jgi:hypothetical protein
MWRNVKRAVAMWGWREPVRPLISSWRWVGTHRINSFILPQNSLAFTWMWWRYRRLNDAELYYSIHGMIWATWLGWAVMDDDVRVVVFEPGLDGYDPGVYHYFSMAWDDFLHFRVITRNEPVPTPAQVWDANRRARVNWAKEGF